MRHCLFFILPATLATSCGGNLPSAADTAVDSGAVALVPGAPSGQAGTLGLLAKDRRQFEGGTPGVLTAYILGVLQAEFSCRWPAGPRGW